MAALVSVTATSTLRLRPPAPSPSGYSGPMRPQYTPLLLALSQAEVRYLVVGGVAVVLHGVLRFTADLDLVIQLEPGNLTRALDVLTSRGLRPVIPVPAGQFADPAIRADWTERRNMLVFTLWDPDRPAVRVDIFVREPWDFDSAFSRRTDVVVEGVPIPLVPITELIAMKHRANRPKDLEDIRALTLLLGRETP